MKMTSVFYGILVLLNFSQAQAQQEAQYKLYITAGVPRAHYNCFIPDQETKDLQSADKISMICMGDDIRDTTVLEFSKQPANDEPLAKIKLMDNSEVTAYGLNLWNLLENPKKLDTCATQAWLKEMQRGIFLGDRKVVVGANVCLQNAKATEAKKTCIDAAVREAQNATDRILDQLAIKSKVTLAKETGDFYGYYSVMFETLETPPRTFGLSVHTESFREGYCKAQISN